MALETQGAQPGSLFGGGSGFGGIWAGGPNTTAEGIGQLGPAAFDQSRMMYGGPFAAAGAQKYGAMLQSETAKMQDATAKRGQELSYNASILPTQLKEGRFQTLLPMVEDAYGKISGQFGNLFGNGGFASAGGTGPSRPTFNTGGIWNGGQVQQQLQGQLATNNQTAANQIRTQQQNLASRGQGSNTALSQALAGMTQNQNLATNTALRRDLPFGYAAQNRQVSDQGLSASEGQAHNVATEDIQRRQPYFGALSSYLQAFNPSNFGSLLG